MKSAILAYNNKDIEFKKAALSFYVPKITLEKRVRTFSRTDNLAKASTKGKLLYLIITFKILIQNC
jgi:hypothetical protein